MRYYILFVWRDVEPSLHGPYDTPDDRDAAARQLREEEGDEHGIYPLDATGQVEVDCYSGAFFEEEVAAPAQEGAGDEEHAYVVSVSRVGYFRSVDIPVTARSEREARHKALDQAGDHVYSEFDAEYEVDDVRQAS